MNAGRLSDGEFQAAARRLDALVQEFEALPLPQVREQVFTLLQAVDALHREALTRLIEGLRAADPAAIDAAATDPVVQTLLVLYDLSDQPLPDLPEQEPQVAAFISRNQIRRPRHAALLPAASIDELPEGSAQGVEVAGARLLLANIDGTVYAVRDHCPGSAAPLSLGIFTPPVVICPWHNEAFDLRTGARADGGEGPGLESVPVTVEGDQILVRLETKVGPRDAARGATP